jgi:aerobic carbon-monoxide dehydrogenase medium subunit
MPSELRYYRPRRLNDAVTLLQKSGSGIHVLAGGTNLLVWMKESVLRPKAIVDIKNIKSLYGIRIGDEGRVIIGPLTPAREVAAWCASSGRLANLKTGAEQLGSGVIRNRATIGGNLCAGSPAGDLSLALLGYETELVIQGPSTRRTLALSSFFKSLGRVDLSPQEILTRIIVKPPKAGSAERYFKLGLRKAQTCTVVGIAVTLSPSDEDPEEVENASIALGSVAPVPMRAQRAESSLKGRKWSSAAADEASALAAEECAPITDLRASKEYRREMVAVLVRRLLKESWEQTRKTRRESGNA